MTPLAAAAAREVEALHRLFVDLFTGGTRDTSRCAAAFAADFTMVTPAGRSLDRAAVVAQLQSARAAPGFRIDILDLHSIWESADSVLLRYVEQQYRDGETTRRLAAALFTAEPTAPCGVVWRYLQETWVQAAGR
jgi:hypothetical protein